MWDIKLKFIDADNYGIYQAEGSGGVVKGGKYIMMEDYLTLDGRHTMQDIDNIF